MPLFLAAIAAIMIFSSAQAYAEPAAKRIVVVTLPAGAAEQAAVSERLLTSADDAGLLAVPASGIDMSLPAAALQQVQELEEQARQSALSLNLPGAVEARRQIVEILEDTLEATVNPSRLARALAQLGATELEAGSETAAARIWRRALALDGALTLDDTFSPRVREAFTLAREQGSTMPPRPAATVLDRLCEAADVMAVLWIATGTDDQGPALMRLLHTRETTDRIEVRHALPSSGPERDAAIDAVLVRIETDLELLGGGTEPPPPPPPPPWYRRWWVWTIAAVIVTGAAVATGLAIGLGEEQVEVTFEFP